VGAIHVQEFMSLDGVIDAPTWTFEYGFDPKMGAAIGAATERCQGILLNAVDYFRCRVGGAACLFALAGRGDPVLLLHGLPQTHYCWRAIIPSLARSHTVVAPDLHGYGAAAARPAANGPRVQQARDRC
jgi:pimeloyl-ACP methyl ester carboxylesterase